MTQFNSMYSEMFPIYKKMVKERFGVTLLGEKDDEVIDIINKFEKRDKDVILKSFDSHLGLNNIVVHKHDGIVYIILKFGLEGDNGLISYHSEDILKLLSMVVSEPELFPEPVRDSLFLNLLSRCNNGKNKIEYTKTKRT
jgi:hypothetical protein